jgi:hypothetical protein
MRTYSLLAFARVPYYKIFTTEIHEGVNHLMSFAKECYHRTISSVFLLSNFTLKFVCLQDPMAGNVVVSPTVNTKYLSGSCQQLPPAWVCRVLTQNVHSAPITQQAEKLSFARAGRE